MHQFPVTIRCRMLSFPLLCCTQHSIKCPIHPATYSPSKHHVWSIFSSIYDAQQVTKLITLFKRKTACVSILNNKQKVINSENSFMQFAYNADNEPCSQYRLQTSNVTADSQRHKTLLFRKKKFQKWQHTNANVQQQLSTKPTVISEKGVQQRAADLGESARGDKTGLASSLSAAGPADAWSASALFRSILSANK